MSNRFYDNFDVPHDSEFSSNEVWYEIKGGQVGKHEGCYAGTPQVLNSTSLVFKSNSGKNDFKVKNLCAALHRHLYIC